MNESTHSLDTDFLCDVGNSVNVDVVELDLLLVCRIGNLLEDGRDHLAGPAPGRPEVEHSMLVLRDLSGNGQLRKRLESRR